MKKVVYIIIAIMSLSFLLVGCGNSSSDVQNNLDKVEQMEPIETNLNKPSISSYVTISAEEAKTVMDGSSDYIILDVRNRDEYDEGHIANAVLLPVDNIEKEAGPVIGGKDKTVLVYCRSGNRSKMASAKLVELGYSDVRNFGGIIDWPYEIVK